MRPDAVRRTEIRSECKRTFTRREHHRLRLSAVAVISSALMTACFGVHLINYSFSSTVTGNVRQYSGPDAFLAETTEARILGAMHFRNSNLVGREPGTSAGEWVAPNFFRKQD